MSENELEIRVLGELELFARGRRVALPASKRTRALLGYLVTTGRPHLRDRLCELLWPDPDDPRAALRWSLTKLRDVVDAKSTPRIVADRERIAFEAKGVALDLARLRSGVAGGVAGATTDALREAASLFRGELLEGLDLRDCYQFHEWCTAEREALRTQRVAILRELVARLSQSDADEALKLARARVAIDPLAEDAHVDVVRLLTAHGRKKEALAQVETCRRILEHELGRKPSPALLHARVATARVEPTGADVAPSEPASIDAVPPIESVLAPSLDAMCPRERDAPIVGRARELAAIAAAIDAAASTAPKHVLLFVGEPGIGKSRLLDELAARVRAIGGVVLAGRAFEAEQTRSYGAWSDALRGAPPEVVDPTVRAAVGPLLPGANVVESNDKGRLLDGVCNLLARARAVAPLVCVVLDDVHWLDEASASLLHFVARSSDAAGLVVACGARAEELRDNDAAERVFRALARDGRLARVEIGVLDADAIAALASAVDPSVDAAIVARESAGNPLFALEIARALGRGVEASESLADLIGDRLARVRDDARELLPWAAAIGRAFDPELVARATGTPPAALVAASTSSKRSGSS